MLSGALDKVQVLARGRFRAGTIVEISNFEDITGTRRC